MNQPNTPLLLLVSPPGGPSHFRALFSCLPKPIPALIVWQRLASPAGLHSLAGSLGEITRLSVGLVEGDPKPLRCESLSLCGDAAPAVYQGERLHATRVCEGALETFLEGFAPVASRLTLFWLPGLDRLPPGLEAVTARLQSLGMCARRLCLPASVTEAESAFLHSDWPAWQNAWPSVTGFGGAILTDPENSTGGTSAAEAAGTRWLIAEDDPTQRAFIKDCCRREGLVCDEAADGLDALRLLAKTAYAGVVMDGTMPEVDGWTALAWIRRERPEVKVLLVSGDALAESHALAEGAEFLAKPFTAEEFRGRLRHLARPD